MAIYPDCSWCTNPLCPKSTSQVSLRKVVQRCAVVYTLGSGAHPAHSIHMYCAGKLGNLLSWRKTLMGGIECNTDYHNNYSLHNGIRTYYEGVPDLIQIGEHQFAERSLVQHWVDLMLTAWYVKRASFILYICTDRFTGFPRAIVLVHTNSLKLVTQCPTKNGSSGSN